MSLMLCMNDTSLVGTEDTPVQQAHRTDYDVYHIMHNVCQLTAWWASLEVIKMSFRDARVIELQCQAFNFCMGIY